MNTSMGIVAALALAALAGCGDSGDAPGNATAATTTATWNAEDACAVLDKNVAAAALGIGVTKTELGSVSPAAEGRAAFSMCTYTLADGGQMMLLTRAAPNGDFASSDVEASRTADGTMPPASDVPGLGRAALWRDQGAQLQVFLDDRRYVAINLSGPSATGDAKGRTIAVAKKML
jgi:hypothetical protein